MSTVERALQFASRWHRMLAFFGLCVVRPHITPSMKIKYTVSYTRIAVSLFWIVVYMGMFYLQIEYTRFEQSSVTAVVFLAVMCFTGNIVVIAIILSSLASCKDLIAYKESAASLDDQSGSFDVSMASKMTLRLMSLCMVYLLGSFAWDYVHFCVGTGLTMLFNILSSYIYQLYNVMVILQYSTCVFWVSKTFKHITDKLTGVLHRRRRGGFEKDETEQNLTISNISNILKSNKVSAQSPLGSMDKNSTAVELKGLRRIYQATYEVSIKLNKAFSTRLMILIFNNFLLGLLFLYLGLSTSIGISTMKTTTYNIVDVLISFRMAISCFLYIYSMIWSANIVYIQGQEICTKIHEVLQETEDADLKAGLRDFLSQVQLQRISFSPHGFFEINNGLLLSLLGAVSSYLVVLLQFRIEV